MTIGRIGTVLLAGCLAGAALPAGCPFPAMFSTAAAHAEEGWQEELATLCARTDEAMGMSVAELKRLVAGCDKLAPVIEGLDESARKVYRKRLKMCRDLYAYVLESKEQKAK